MNRSFMFIHNSRNRQHTQDYMISFRFNQSDTERAGRTMTLTKPALRMSLGNTHFKQAVWVAFNSPGFHEVDILAFVRRWMADGHLAAVMHRTRGRSAPSRCSSARRVSTSRASCARHEL